MTTKGRTNTKTQRTCLGCKTEFMSGKCNGNYCSHKCRRYRVEKSCKVCGTQFEGFSQTLTCSATCKAKCRIRFPERHGIKTCEVCSVSFVPKTTRWTRTCGRTCAYALRVKEGTNSWIIDCTWQGKMTTWMKRKQQSWKTRLNQCPQCGGYCATQVGRCDRCIKRLSAKGLASTLQRVQEWLKRSTKKCDQCDNVAEWHCSICTKCAKQREKALKKASSHKGRCLRHNCEYQANVSIGLIIERDGIKCHYCRVKTTRSCHNAPTQAEIDHVIPISKGGGHTMANVVIACRKCNGAKHDKEWTLF